MKQRHLRRALPPPASLVTAFSLLLIFTALCASIVRADDDGTPAILTLAPSVTVASDYVDRGQLLLPGPSIQPALTLAYALGDFGTLSAGAWFALPASKPKDHQDFWEWDNVITYTALLGPATLIVSNTWITYYNAAGEQEPTSELAAALSFHAPLSPTLNFVRDYRNIGNNYFEVSVSHSFEQLEKLGGASVVPFFTLGFSTNSERAYARDGLEQFTTGVYFEVPFGDLVCTPSINYTHGIDETTTDRLWFGLSFAGERTIF